jgi:hypothetical protein
MVTQAASWEGPYPIETMVTPMRVSIHNDSRQPLHIRYGNFSLISPGGDTHSALPPFEIQGSIEEPVIVRTSPQSFYAPLFVSDHFYFAPYYDGIYPDITIERKFTYDPNYYTTYYTYWRDIDLPTPEMRQQAIPEGILQPGGHLEGQLYFEKVDVGVPRVVFRADLVNAQTGRQFGEIRIPFEVN